MAESLILDRELARRGESRELTPEEREHHNRIADNYRRLILEGAVNVRAQSEAVIERPEAVEAEAPVAEPEVIPSAADRIAAYTPVEAVPEVEHRGLFEGLVYHNGELVTEVPATAETEQVIAPVEVAAPVIEPDTNEDAVPTRRTMETIRQEVEKAPEEATKTGFLAALSVKTKIALATVAAVVVIMLSIIGINAGVIRSLDARIASREASIAQLTEESERILEEINNLRDPETIGEWATANGMTRS